ncbi:hypothetical protein JMG10_15470 [Nostoc ellipsosporum NOK]|nr:hypothetical protein [Nostoc ellipsosporum NOK]
MAEEQQRARRLRQVRPGQPPLLVEHRIEPVEHQQARARIRQRGGEQFRLVANPIGTIERAAGEAGRARHLARSA